MVITIHVKGVKTGILLHPIKRGEIRKKERKNVLCFLERNGENNCAGLIL